MHARRFDRLTQLVAARATRRTTLKGAAAGVSAALLGQRVTAQNATPVAADTPIELLFVQSFSTGTLVEDGGGDYTLTLEDGSGQTIYFSDRPDRLVGAISDEAFLDGRAFNADDPPNAAIVAQTATGEDVLIVELFDPLFDEAGGVVSYTARPLTGQPKSPALANYTALQDDATLDDTFGPVSLFIDNLACSQDGASCNANSDCCSGFCCDDIEICPPGLCVS